MKRLTDGEEEIKTSIAFLEQRMESFGKSFEDLRGQATANSAVDELANCEQKIESVQESVKWLKNDARSTKKKIAILDLNLADQKTEINSNFTKMMVDSLKTHYALVTSVMKLASFKFNFDIRYATKWSLNMIIENNRVLRQHLNLGVWDQRIDDDRMITCFDGEGFCNWSLTVIP